MGERAYGQQSQMEDPSMAGTLRAQAEMIWPLERPILERLGVPGAASLADLGCGTGEFAGRVARAWPDVSVRGLDLFDRHVALAREAWPPEALINVRFVQGDARDTGWESDRFDVVTIRHVLHALPDGERLLAEAQRILRPGGLLYVLAEDYAGLLFDAPDEAAQRLFLDAREALRSRETELFHGRAAFRELRRAGCVNTRVDPLVVDTCNTDRETLTRMLRHWRDGYAQFIADAGGLDPADITARFESLMRTARDPERYACWLLFAVSGRKPLL